MSVLELDEESRSLREAALGWSNGELGIDDYRMIRRATLEGKLGLQPGSSADDTEDADDTAREAVDNPDDETKVVGAVHVDSAPASGRRMFIGSVLVVALLFVLLGFLVR